MHDYLTELGKHWKGDMIDYFRKRASLIIRLSNGGLFCFEKPRIETSFCFGYGHSSVDTESYDNANKMVNHARTNEQFFLDSNLADFDRIFACLKKDCSHPHLRRVIYGDDRLNIFDLCNFTHWEWENKKKSPDVVALNDDDRKRIEDGAKHERAKFERRLHTYLKRYGLSKIKSWSYWADA